MKMLMDKWPTRFVLAVTAVILAMVSGELNIRNPDSVLEDASRQSEDLGAGTGSACVGRDGRPCDARVEIRLPSARDGAIEREIARWLDHWGTGGRGSVRAALKRMGRYEDYIDAELAARNLPPSLRYLPLIEADYHQLAISPAGAAGIWQLMPGTARWLGLEVNSLVDQRFDVYAATEAALDYLIALHDRFECWFLALAAYNAGPTRIERAIRWHGESRPRNDALFGHIRDWLPEETRDFVPKFLAIVSLAGDRSVIAREAAEKDPPERFDVVRVEGAASSDVLAEAAGIAEDEIRTLNPHLRIGLVPAGRAIPLRVPAGAGRTFLARFAGIPAGERSTLREHTVARGETLGRLARLYGVPLGALRTVNPDVEPRRMHVGTVLVIPRSAGAATGGFRIAANPSSTRFGGIR